MNYQVVFTTRPEINRQRAIQVQADNVGHTLRKFRKQMKKDGRLVETIVAVVPGSYLRAGLLNSI